MFGDYQGQEANLIQCTITRTFGGLGNPKDSVAIHAIEAAWTNTGDLKFNLHVAPTT